MNKNFKVVFSKARGALMVVNELTSSVQAKGTKTVIAAAVASVVAGTAVADTNTNVFEGKTEYTDSSLFQAWTTTDVGQPLEVSGNTYRNNHVVFPTTSGSPTALGVAAREANVSIIDSTFTANKVEDQVGSQNGVYGSAVGVQNGKLTVSGSTFTENNATSYRQVQGSAIY